MSDTSLRQYGVEQEHFVFHDDGTPPTHEEIERLWAGLCSCDFQIHAVNNHGRVLSVARILPQGFVVVSNDGCTHIVEVALPPYRVLSEFRRDYCETWDLVEQQLSGMGLHIRLGGALPTPPSNVFWRPKDSDPEGERMNKLVHRDPLCTTLYHPDFSACFAATQVSLGIEDNDAIRLLPGYYSFEFLVPLWFSTSPSFLAVKAPCVRPLAFDQNFHQPYPLLGIPDSIPRDLNEYAELRSQCSLRDYSFVAIRNAERLEFRSACSQPTIDAIEQLIRFRLAIDLAVRDGVVGNWNPRTAFYDACWGKQVGAYSQAVCLLNPYLERCGVRSGDANSITQLDKQL